MSEMLSLDQTAPTMPDPVPDAGCGPLGPHEIPGPRPLRRQVFECVRAAGLIARVDVARELGVSPATVTAMATELIDAGWLHEQVRARPDGDPVRGRPPVALGVRPGAGLVAGIKLSDRGHSAVILDFAGGLVAAASAPASGRGLRGPLGALLDETETVLDAALATGGLARGDLACVGLGLPGVIDHAAGKAMWSPLLAARDVDLRAALIDRLGVRAEIDNDVNLLTLAELWFGAGRELADFVLLTIEHGVGMGLVLNNRLHRGAQGLGMEIGHTKVQLDGALCRCGRRGCLEAYVADYALVREASTALDLDDAGTQPIPQVLEALFREAKSGNAAATAIFHRAGRYLAMGMSNVVNLFDPSLIILSGARMRYDYLYAEEVLAEMHALTLDIGRAAPKVEINAWGDLVWARGAAALALDTATRASLSPEATL
ncbi:MAG: putative NBD/HSP70 family sugar kinase [Paracoccaceae bacterium]|jgi:predicted NBD/HSP70 family sugar kinase